MREIGKFLIVLGLVLFMAGFAGACPNLVMVGGQVQTVDSCAGVGGALLPALGYGGFQAQRFSSASYGIGNFPMATIALEGRRVFVNTRVGVGIHHGLGGVRERTVIRRRF